MINAIVLAAGRSLRMGTQKLLLPFAGQTVMGHVVDQVLAGPIDRTVVVTSRDIAAIKSALAGRNIAIVQNLDSDSEMLESIRVGLRAVAADSAAAIVVLGDQPAIRTEFVAKLVEAFRTTGRGIVVPLHGGKRGHPLLVAAKYFEEILTSHDAVGLRGLLAAHGDDVLEVRSPDDCVLADIDFPDDYRRELERYANSLKQ